VSEKGRILIADDEETFRFSTADLLRSKGYHCDCVVATEEAIDALARDRYDLLIADLLMPGNPRLELIHTLQSAGGTLPIILVTAYPTLESALEAVRLPVIAYLVKPFEFEDLLAEVERGIRWSRLSRAVDSTQDRLDHWKSELAGVEGVLRSDSPDAQARSLEAFLSVTLRNIAGGLADLERIAHAVSGRPVAPDACHLLNCPRHARLVAALAEAVAVLERTKSSFRSRELGSLRRSLEIILNEERGQSA